MRGDVALSLAKLANFPTEYDWIDKPNRKEDSDSAPPKRTSVHNGKPALPPNRIRCHNCGVIGHKSTYCQEEPRDQDELNELLAEDKEFNSQSKGVMCFYCQLYGHYANVCPER